MNDISFLRISRDYYGNDIIRDEFKENCLYDLIENTISDTQMKKRLHDIRKKTNSIIHPSSKEVTLDENTAKKLLGELFILISDLYDLYT